jgi:hypothetical protein
MKLANYIRAAILIGIAAVLPCVFGGTVITANLPANTAIVNIDGRADGTTNFDGGQSEPFFSTA